MTMNFSQHNSINLNSILKYNKNDNFITKSYNDFVTGKYRFEREKNFYLHCLKIKYKNVPRIYKIDDINLSIDIEYIEKDLIFENNKDILITYFCNFINSINKNVIKSNFTTAQEAVLTTDSLINNIDLRINRLINIKKPLYEILILYRNLKKNYFSMNCKAGDLILNPSDFGVHNIIINECIPYFIDFEYAGIDSLQKTYFDFLLHPKNNLIKDFEENYYSIQNESNFKLDYNESELKIVKNLYIIWWIIRLFESIEKLNVQIDNEYLINERINNINNFMELLDYDL